MNELKDLIDRIEEVLNDPVMDHLKDPYYKEVWTDLKKRSIDLIDHYRKHVIHTCEHSGVVFNKEGELTDVT